MRERLWYICCGTLTYEHMDMMHTNETITCSTISTITQSGGCITVSYLQCLHLTPNIMLLRHTWHVWESQDLVENLQKKEKNFFSIIRLSDNI